MSSLLISCRGVQVTLGERRVLQGVDLDVRASEVLALVGPNGGGKTTLIRTLAGLLKPTAGTIRWYNGGRELERPSFPIGYVAQRITADFRYPVTVREVVGMPLLGAPRLRSTWSAEGRRRIDAALARLKISHLADRTIGRLSGGQQQRALIARALVVKPLLLLLDEPTSGIDAPGQEELIELLVALRDREEAGIVISTHHPGEAVSAIDRGFIVDCGVRSVPVDQLDQQHLLTTGGCEPLAGRGDQSA